MLLQADGDQFAALAVIEFKFNLFALRWWRAENTGAMKEPVAALVPHEPEALFRE